ncbi:MAG: type II toxin-antitoxin system RelB/DinJ family antitoxin [Candidatus Omnitrophica bacterium]|nr:type II toxin-antitoxin system RelB/DinJ family antitoxin [Candidatus Omnitrophota bacterium]MBU0878253.1 type II toxin-antitoxin system RelB/DinJ family antitoxin [Candidatus Omnitrophota bacterium]MBU0896349.1 type II toxin-antitoxin system RelB/DinJ family antitoxin [Candidatus Omnitrophota bacterium]MBU1366624.1 type II toxin-antitoxin system RelB/DinJ family antitoxin [Candidatus Omnitrophota bacterium]MBU1524607.1 type II toxin-antitoxin system RelB/DinJ family antitoxin [Candidatus Om
MAKTEMIRARTEPGLKNEVERIFHLLGLSCTEAINLFFHQVKLRKGLPFEVKIPNKTTLKAIEDVREYRGLIKSKDAKKMFKKLGI